MFEQHSMYSHIAVTDSFLVCVHIHVDVHIFCACGGQSSTSGVVPELPFSLAFIYLFIYWFWDRVSHGSEAYCLG